MTSCPLCDSNIVEETGACAFCGSTPRTRPRVLPRAEISKMLAQVSEAMEASPAGVDLRRARSLLRRANEALESGKEEEASRLTQALLKALELGRKRHAWVKRLEDARAKVEMAARAGLDVTQAEKILSELEERVRSGSFEGIASRLREALKGIDISGRMKQVERSISAARKRISYARERGGRTDKAMEFLQEAERALGEGNLPKAADLVKKATRAADYARKNARAHQLISSVERALQAAAARGADVSEGIELLSRAKRALKSGVYADVQKWTRAARDFAERARRERVAEEEIHRVERLLEDEAKEGSDLSATTPILEEAWKALREGSFSLVKRHLQRARRAAEEAARLRKAREEVELVRADLRELRAMKANPAKVEEALGRAEDALQREDWRTFRTSIQRARRAAKRARKERERELILTTVEKLVEKAGKGGVSAIGARELLAEVEKALGRGRYTDIDTLVEAKFEAEATKKENEILRRIGQLRTEMAELKVAGIEVSAAVGLLDRAEEALRSKEISQAQALLKRAEEVSLGLKEALRGSAERALGDLEDEIGKLRALDITVPQAEEFLARGRVALEAGNAFEALDLARLALEACKEARKEHFEEIAARELEQMRTATAREEAKKRIEHARELSAVLERAGLDRGGLEEAITRAEEALEAGDEESIRLRLQVLEEMGHSLRGSLRAQIEARLQDLQAGMQDLGRAEAIERGLERARKALEEDLVEVALEECLTAERKLEQLRAKRSQEEMKAQVKALKRLSSQFVRVKRMLDELRKAGIDVSESQERLKEAEKALQAREASKVETILTELEEIASSVRGGLVTAARDLIASARLRLQKASKHWERIPEAEEMLRNAEELFQQGRFDEAIEFAKLAERKARSRMEQFIERANAEVMGRRAQAEARLLRLRGVMKDLQRADISIEGSEEALSRVEEALEEGDFETAEEHLSSVEEMAEVLTSGLRVAAEDLLRKTGEEVERARAEGLEIPRGEQVYQTALEVLKQGRYVEALEYCKVIEDIVEGARQRSTLEEIAAELEGIRRDVAELEERGISLTRTQGLLDRIREMAARGELERATAMVEELKDVLGDLKASREEGAPEEDRVQEVVETLARLDSLLESGDLEEVRELLSQATIKLGGSSAEGLRARLDRVREEVETAREIGADVKEVQAALREAESAAEEDPAAALESLNRVEAMLRAAVKGKVEEASPQIVLELPEEGLEEGRWTRYEILVRNSGKLPARQVTIRLRGDLEVKGLEPLPELRPGEERRIEVGVRPTKAGEIPVDVEVAFRRSLDNQEIFTTSRRRVLASPPGTYVVEDVFLVHRDGRLISHQSRKTLDQIDEDIFSGMLTVVQDFVKDSFRQRTRVGLKRLEFGESKILIERGSYVYLAAVLMGEEPRLLPLYMAEVINEIERKYGDKLERWTGLLSELEGIDDIVKKLVYLTQAEVIEGPEEVESALESAVELIHGAKTFGLDVSASEELLQAAEEAVKEDPTQAWALVQSAVEKALETQQQLRERLEAGMKALEGDVEELSHLGVPYDAGRTELEKARRALTRGNYQRAARILASLDESISALKEQVVADKIDKDVERLRLILLSLEREGADTSQVRELLERAKTALEEGRLGEVVSHLEGADAASRELRKSFLLKKYEEELKGLESVFEEASAAGVVPEEAQEIIQKAEEAADRADVDELEMLVMKAREATLSQIQGSLEGKEPKVLVKMPEEGLQTGTWNRYIVEVVNRGNWPAKDVEVRFGGDVKVKGVTRVERLDPSESRKLEIGLWPTRDGEATVDLEVSYKRLLDDAPFVMRDMRDLRVAPKGTYAVEDALLFHESGDLIVHESRKFREELDEEAFSNMLQAVQEFVRDSFQSKANVGIKKMEFGDSRVLLERGDRVFLAVVVLGREPDLLPLYMLQILKEVEDTYGEHLESKPEDPEVVEGIRRIVSKLLLATDSEDADLGPLASSPVTAKLLYGMPKRQRKQRVQALVQDLNRALEEGGMDRGLEVLESALGEEVAAGPPEEATRPVGEGEEAYSIEVDDVTLKEYIEIVKEIDKAVNKARGKAGLEAHWPVPRLAIRAMNPMVAAAANSFKAMIMSHANAKELDILQEGEIWKGVDLKMQINEEALAKAYKVWAKKIELILRSQDPWKIKAGIDRGGYEMGIEGQVIRIFPGMASFQAIIPPHVVVQEFPGGMVFMDTRMTEETKAEGFANEIIRIILEARKEMTVEDSQPISVRIMAGEEMRALLGRMKKYIMEEVNARDLVFASDPGDAPYVVDVEIKDESFTLAVSPG